MVRLDTAEGPSTYVRGEEMSKSANARRALAAAGLADGAEDRSRAFGRSVRGRPLFSGTR